jgi:hypothetical protein
MAGELIYPNYNLCLFIQFVAYFEFYVPRVIMPHPFAYSYCPTYRCRFRRGGGGRGGRWKEGCGREPRGGGGGGGVGDCCC